LQWRRTPKNAGNRCLRNCRSFLRQERGRFLFSTHLKLQRENPRFSRRWRRKWRIPDRWRVALLRNNEKSPTEGGRKRKKKKGFLKKNPPPPQRGFNTNGRDCNSARGRTAGVSEERDSSDSWGAPQGWSGIPLYEKVFGRKGPHKKRGKAVASFLGGG